ncbi:Solute carrier family 35 member G1 [Holothuria leucospilota]|uniref:Solute carrier family 35 member G1 n=1 Tax=Holothuria leucospilota TaxID=206669 RepID=A0A9Q1C5Q5_HOLLE|nr:Solute carrier family 35 member G1 [Holothuria leucospilota]
MKKNANILAQDRTHPNDRRSDQERRLLISKDGKGSEGKWVSKNTENNSVVRGLQSWLKGISSGSKIQGIFIAISFTFFMATRNVFAQLSTKGLSPFAVAAMDRIVTGLCCVPYLIIQKISPRVSAADTFVLVIRGVCSAVVLSSLIAALEKLPVGDASAIQSLASIPAGIWGALFLGERFGLVDFMCALLGALGFSLISKPDFIFNMDTGELSEHLEGYGLALLSAFSLSVIFPISRFLLKSKIDPVLIVFWLSLTSATLTGALATFMGQWSNVWCNPSLVYVILMGGCAFFANVLIVVSLSILDTFEVAILNQNVIIFAYMLQVTLLSVSPSWLSLLGAAMIILACIITTIHKSINARS